MSPCNAPGPNGLRCDLYAHHGKHERGLGGRAVVQWESDARTGEPLLVALWPAPLREGLAALSTALHAIGDACRAGAR